jgi:hypothetical protein
MPQDKPKFDLEILGDDAILTLFPTENMNKQTFQFPCSIAGDIADALNQLWLDWHSPEILERESESQRQVERPFNRDEIPF